MNIFEFIIFCIGLFTVSAVIGALSAALGSRFGKFLGEKI